MITVLDYLTPSPGWLDPGWYLDTHEGQLALLLQPAQVKLLLTGGVSHLLPQHLPGHLHIHLQTSYSEGAIHKIIVTLTHRDNGTSGQ